MPKKEAIQYVCRNCGNISGSWSGKCFSCGEWNTLQEELSSLGIRQAAKKGNTLISQTIQDSIEQDYPRLELKAVGEVDLVLGGGIVRGSIVLIAGQPGIGKSTILLQIASELANRYNVLYISGEESAHQVGMRAKRLRVEGLKLKLTTSTSADDVASTIIQGDFDLVVVDSVQTMICNAIASAAGSVSQITNSTQLLSAAAKSSNTALILVGHVTKEGSIAGPKILEHLVDVVLQLEGDRYGGFKVLRAIKNRYGTTNEAAIFEMDEKGLQSVDNPSAALLAERQISDGSVVMATMEGSRPLLVEVQALVNPTSYGYPKRTASGLDLNRLNLLIAMLERRTKLNLANQDVYINIVGGIRINEPAADLAICMAIASATKGMQLSRNAVVFGEVGLSGEIRHVPNIDKRRKEGDKLGFDGAIGPNLKGNNPKGYYPVASVRDALNTFLSK